MLTVSVLQDRVKNVFSVKAVHGHTEADVKLTALATVRNHKRPYVLLRAPCAMGARVALRMMRSMMATRAVLRPVLLYRRPIETWPRDR